MGISLRYGLRWTDAEVVVDEWGKPSMLIHNSAALRMQQLGATAIWVSMSHDGDYAVAQVVLE